ncbi:hypothetical protein ACM0JF_01050 [Mycoplasma sp. 654]|uniref:hypothetical protein n=1 Tax=Mycoplasma sp. 654 TaxID=3398773 RepID=UPI003A8400F2
MAQKEISFLSDLGINFQAFQESEFNTQKPFKIPKKIYSIMPSASNEEIFTKTLFSVYNSCNALINNVINLLAIKLDYDAAKFIEAAGQERITLFKSAIFNEVNYRFTTQTTPELFNRLTIAPNNAQILGTPRDFYLAEQYLNPIAKKFLEDCEWDRLGVELGEAYNKAFEISEKLETFKNETSKAVKFELDYCQTQAERIRERCATLLDDKSYDITGKAISRIEASRDNYIGMLETNYKRLKNNADTEAEFRINKIKDVQKNAKDDVSKIVETAKLDIDSKFNTAKKELENKFLPVPDAKDKAEKLAREYGFVFMHNIANFSSALDEHNGKIAWIEYELKNSKPNLEPLKQEIEKIKADVINSERNVELELKKLDEATEYIQYVGKQADKNSNAIKKIDPIIKLLEQNKELATKDDLKNLPAGGGIAQYQELEVITKAFRVDKKLEEGESSYIAVPMSANLIVSGLWVNSKTEQAPLMVPITLPKPMKSMAQTINFWACDPQMNNEAGLFEISFSHWLDKKTTQYNFILHTFKRLGGNLELDVQDLEIELTGQLAKMD